MVQIWEALHNPMVRALFWQVNILLVVLQTGDCCCSSSNRCNLCNLSVATHNYGWHVNRWKIRYVDGNCFDSEKNVCWAVLSFSKWIQGYCKVKHAINSRWMLKLEAELRVITMSLVGNVNSGNLCSINSTYFCHETVFFSFLNNWEHMSS